MRSTTALLGVAFAMFVGPPMQANDTIERAGQTERSHVADSSANNEHSQVLQTILVLARASLESCRQEIRDYTCTMIAQERVDGRLQRVKRCRAKVRQTESAEGGSISVYLNFQAPRSMQGREVLWSSHENNGKMLVRNGGRYLASMTAMIEPTGTLAMKGSRHSIHEFGIQRLIERMIEFGETDLADGDCEIKVCKDIEMDDRRCTSFEIRHPVQRDDLPFYLARIYIDDQLQLPIRFDAYDWPADKDGKPVLMERYVYRDLKLNVGLTDADFSKDNSDYQFR